MSLLESSGLSSYHVKDMIVKKMTELKCPGDEEFAEYVIVMLHNNKLQSEIQAQLEPFLGNQSAIFTPWLFTILNPDIKSEDKTPTPEPVKKSELEQLISNSDTEDQLDTDTIPKKKKRRKVASSSSSSTTSSSSDSSSGSSSSSSSGSSSDESDRKNGYGKMRSDRIIRREQKMKVRSPPKRFPKLNRTTEKQLEILRAIQAIDFTSLLEEEKRDMKVEADEFVESPKAEVKKHKHRNYRKSEKSRTEDNKDFSDISDEESSRKTVSKYANVASSFIDAVQGATLKVTTDRGTRRVEAARQMEGIKLPLIVELAVDPHSGKPVILSIEPAVKLEDIPDYPERKHKAYHDWGRVEAGVVRNAVPNLEMPEFKREVVHATKVVVNELNDKQSRVVVRCKFWPDCPHSKTCRHHHPTEPCEKFPQCEAVISCYKIHPICKFNMLCRIGQCKYTHTDTTNRKIQKIIPCYYGKECPSIDECFFLHWKGEIKPKHKSKKSKNKHNKKKKKKKTKLSPSFNAAGAMNREISHMKSHIKKLNTEQVLGRNKDRHRSVDRHFAGHSNDMSNRMYSKSSAVKEKLYSKGEGVVTDSRGSTYKRSTWDSPEKEDDRDESRWTP